MKLNHPKDWIAHALLCLAVCLLFGPEIAATVGITIELTQLESGIFQGWDHVIDLGSDAIGILLGLVALRLRKSNKESNV